MVCYATCQALTCGPASVRSKWYHGVAADRYGTPLRQDVVATAEQASTSLNHDRTAAMTADGNESKNSAGSGKWPRREWGRHYVLGYSTNSTPFEALPQNLSTPQVESPWLVKGATLSHAYLRTGQSGIEKIGLGKTAL